jgi:hypothetical protein
MHQLQTALALTTAALTLLVIGYRLGRWHQRTIHVRELVRRRLFAGRN